MNLLKEGLCPFRKLLEDLVSRCKENLSLGLTFLLFPLPLSPQPALTQRALGYSGNTSVFTPSISFPWNVFSPLNLSSIHLSFKARLNGQLFQEALPHCPPPHQPTRSLLGMPRAFATIFLRPLVFPSWGGRRRHLMIHILACPVPQQWSGRRAGG